MRTLLAERAARERTFFIQEFERRTERRGLATEDGLSCTEQEDSVEGEETKGVDSNRKPRDRADMEVLVRITIDGDLRRRASIVRPLGVLWESSKLPSQGCVKDRGHAPHV